MVLDFIFWGDYPQGVALESCLLFYEILEHSKLTKGVIDAKGCVFILFYVHAFMFVNLLVSMVLGVNIIVQNIISN
jgi:hypothetical protein